MTRLDMKAFEKPRTKSGRPVKARCLCGDVALEIDFPAFWAWHDHGAPSRIVHGAAYATYVGTWKKHFRFTKGEGKVGRFIDEKTNTTRGFCPRCGTPLTYEKKRSPHFINVPRALFSGRTGREPRYHLNIQERQDWAYAGEPLVPLKGYPGVVWVRPRTKKRPLPPEF